MSAAKEAAHICSVLGAEARARILELLKERSLCVGALAARLNITQGAVSQHLRILRQVGLVTPDKRGYYVHYSINKETLKEWRGVLDKLLSSRRRAKGRGPYPVRGLLSR